MYQSHLRIVACLLLLCMGLGCQARMTVLEPNVIELHGHDAEDHFDDALADVKAKHMLGKADVPAGVKYVNSRSGSWEKSISVSFALPPIKLQSTKKVQVVFLDQQAQKIIIDAEDKRFAPMTVHFNGDGDFSPIFRDFVASLREQGVVERSE